MPKRRNPVRCQEVVGLVADLVSVNVQHAAIVDVALGEMAQYVVVDGDRVDQRDCRRTNQTEWACRIDPARLIRRRWALIPT